MSKLNVYRLISYFDDDRQECFAIVYLFYNY